MLKRTGIILVIFVLLSSLAMLTTDFDLIKVQADVKAIDFAKSLTLKDVSVPDGKWSTVLVKVNKSDLLSSASLKALNIKENAKLDYLRVNLSVSVKGFVGNKKGTLIDNFPIKDFRTINSLSEIVQGQYSAKALKTSKLKLTDLQPDQLYTLKGDLIIAIQKGKQKTTYLQLTTLGKNKKPLLSSMNLHQDQNKPFEHPLFALVRKGMIRDNGVYIGMSEKELIKKAGRPSEEDAWDGVVSYFYKDYYIDMEEESMTITYIYYNLSKNSLFDIKKGMSIRDVKKILGNNFDIVDVSQEGADKKNWIINYENTGKYNLELFFTGDQDYVDYESDSRLEVIMVNAYSPYFD